eukprot:TRINITY_DN15676_c0_g1_i1.p1 TRINITY_DN15676_c0_g1~~TRINITY_DN15676_c0_g1_i1.p1  ORF type:complete len:130 (+),score=25.33 TRINITY_DN15676_c0_g1_i1:784-1173(+)
MGSGLQNYNATAQQFMLAPKQQLNGSPNHSSNLSPMFQNSPFPNNSVDQHQNAGNRPECQIYGKRGHSALRCWYRWDFSYQEQENLPRALAAVSLQDANDPNIYVDTGTNAHMTNNPGPEDGQTLGNGK